MPLHFSIEEQTVPAQSGELQFAVDPANVAIVHLYVTYPDGKKMDLSFHRNGLYIGATAVEEEKPAEDAKEEAHTTRKRDRHSVE